MTDTTTAAGLFIALEGADGAGKTLMVQHLAERFQLWGVQVVTTREIGNTKIGNKLRAMITGSDPETKDEPMDKHARLLMVLASRIQHVKNLIFPAVAAGKIVISDRCFDSTFVYQGRKDKLLPILSVLENLEEIRYLGQRPDHTLFFDVSPDVSMERTAHERAFDNTMNQEGGLQERTDDIMSYRIRMQEAKSQRADSVIVIDADKSIEEVKNQLNIFVDGIMAKRVLAQQQHKQAA